MNKKSDEERDFVRYEGGLEGKLAVAALILLILGLFAAGLLLIENLSKGGIVIAAALAVISWVVWLVLNGLAEIIRLQKKANNLPYSGEISEAKGVAISRCEVCGEVLAPGDWCYKCSQQVPAIQPSDNPE